MNELIIDLREVNTKQELHNRLSANLDFLISTEIIGIYFGT
jgi:hypothetical protein